MNKSVKGINQLRVGAVISYLNMAFGTLIPMFYTPLMLQLLGQNEYGLYKLSSSVTSYLSLISFGIGSAIVRYLIKFRVQKDKDGEQQIFGLFNVIFWIISAITLLAGVVICFVTPYVYSASLNDSQLVRMQIMVIILTMTTAVSFISTPYTSVVTSHERFVFLQIINILTTVVNPIVNIIVLMMGYKSIGMVVSSFVLTIVIRIVYVVYVRKAIDLRPKYSKMPTYLIKEILVFSFWVFVANVVNQLYNTTDTIIIGAIPALATVGVAVYNVGATFSTMMSSFSVGLMSVTTPKVNTLVFSNNNNTELTDLMIRIGRLQSYIVSIVCTGFIAFGQPFIKLWAGENYGEAYWVAIATMIPTSIPLVQNIALSIIVAQNKHRFRSLVYLAIAIANVLGTIACVNYFGIIGAAVVTGIASVIGQGFVMNWYYWKKIGLEIPRFWKNISKLFVIPIVMCVLTLMLNIFVDFDSWFTLFAGIIVYTVVFALANWIFVMNDYEKDIFRGPVKKVIGIFKKKG